MPDSLLRPVTSLSSVRQNHARGMSPLNIMAPGEARAVPANLKLEAKRTFLETTRGSGPKAIFV